MADGANVRISVLTPSFNQARWLSDNLESVANQSCSLIEHIVMDGGSTDGSVDLMSNHRGRVIWESAPDRGQSHALNKALARSQGDIIGWLNSDDAYFSRDAVALALEAFEDKRVGVVYGHAALVAPDGRVLQVMWVPPHSPELLRRHNYIVQPAAFIRRAALVDGFADEAFDYMMDRELWLRLSTRWRFHRVDRILAIDRHHPARKSYTLLDVAKQDDAVLQQRFATATGRRAALSKKGRKLVFRVMGAKKLREVSAADLAFEGRRQSTLGLAVRQLLIPRRLMRLEHP